MHCNLLHWYRHGFSHLFVVYGFAVRVREKTGIVERHALYTYIDTPLHR